MPQLNFKTQTPETLERIATELERTAASLRVRADHMREDRIRELNVPNYTILMRGMEYIEKFAAAVRKSIVDFNEGKGAYSSIGGKKTARKKTRKRGKGGQ